MTFTFEQAKRIIEHYKYLIGKKMSVNSTEMDITDVLIAPSEHEQQIKFISEFNQLRNNELSLAKSGFDTAAVVVFIVHHDTFRGDVWTSDIDKYLTRMGIEKVYESEGFNKS